MGAHKICLANSILRTVITMELNINRNSKGKYMWQKHVWTVEKIRAERFSNYSNGTHYTPHK